MGQDMTTTHRSTISAFIICQDEEKNIRRCLESVKWCDEIVVVDSGSKDRTLEICGEYGAVIYKRPWPGYVEQKRFGLKCCTSEWVLNIDADEEVSPELQRSISNAMHQDERGVNGFQINRVVFFLGKWWRNGGWYPEYRLRVCRRTATSWGGEDPHEKAIVEGAVRRLEGELYHYTYRDIAHQIATLNNYSTQAALSLFRKGKRSSPLRIILNPISRWIKWFILKQGFKEGFAGFVMATLEAYYVFLKYVKLWELSRRDNQTH
jgi:glycosyltransferase involved in cell wall biosynthesis